MNESALPGLQQQRSGGVNSTDTGTRTSDMPTNLLVDCGISIFRGKLDISMLATVAEIAYLTVYWDLNKEKKPCQI